jgi:putative flippase GtrA
MQVKILQMRKLAIYLYNLQFVRYLFVGGTTFILDEGLLITFHGVLNIWLPLALFMSYLIAFVYNFSLNRWWAFSAAETSTIKKHIKPYAILFVFNLVFSIVFVSLASHYINYAVAKAISVAVQTTWTFFAYRKYIFVSLAVS